jgi:2-amino-4-hydroxy-6-hydroxymethyldihydropteridine diphosphokinase
VTASALYRTEPVGDAGQPWYVNAVARVRTALPVEAFFRELQVLEQGAGRPENRRSGEPRTLDLDLLLFDTLVLDTPGLVLPHPRMWERRFVLEPLVEIAPRVREPRSGRPISDLLRALHDPARVEKLPAARDTPGSS